MIEVDQKVKASDLPPDVEVDDFCTVRINLEANTVEFYSIDLEVTDAEGNCIGTISRTGGPLCTLPLDTFAWTFVPSKGLSRLASRAPDVCPECCRIKAACTCPEEAVPAGDLEEAERIKRAGAS